MPLRATSGNPRKRHGRWRVYPTVKLLCPAVTLHDGVRWTNQALQNATPHAVCSLQVASRNLRRDRSLSAKHCFYHAEDFLCDRHDISLIERGRLSISTWQG